MQIDADLLLNYQRCRRRAFLDAYGDASQQDPPNEYLLKLLQDSRANQQQVLAGQTVYYPSYPSGDLVAGSQATLALMQQGVDRIAQGVLIATTEAETTLVSVPDLLIREPGRSDFGDWRYVPAEIKLGKRPKLEYQIVAAFHAYVLAQVQGAWMETSWLILREKGMYAVDLWEMLPRMQELLADCIQTMGQSDSPDVFISRSRCSLCHWLGQCHTIARNHYHLSLLPGVTQSRYAQLQAVQLTTVKALAETNPTFLEPLPGFGAETAHRLVRQARSLLHDCALLIDESDRLAPWSNALLPIAPVELYFDIEAEPSLDVAYLHGVLVIDRIANTQTFYPLLAEHPDDEVLAWQQFLDLVWRYPTAPIFHFCPYEPQTVERLGNLYGTPQSLIQPLLERFVDLHDWITQTVTLPVESYALKPIARWIGFEWHDPNANGAQSICWYSQWLETGDRTYLQAILTYNEDDCRATHHVKNWLVGFLQEAFQAELA